MPDTILDGQPYVFISYASTDRERVRDIAVTLREAGFSCWLDQHDIAGGANWGGSIADAIEGCTALVLMSSAASLASRNVRQEIALAWQHDKPYIPLLLDNTAIPNDVAYWLATAQWIEVLDHPTEVWLPKVTHALTGVYERQPDTQAALDSADRPQQLISLPSPPSAFFGREREVAEIAALLHTERIVTLVGSGGVGKTRIAIAVGHRLTGTNREGVVFVDLAPLRDPNLVLPTIAAVLHVRESGEMALAEVLAVALRSRHLLLILDNMEQVIEAARDISRLVTACPSLAVLATSREPLRIGGEVEYSVTPLPVPSSDWITEPDRLRTNPTVALFVQRARASRANFDLTPDNADAITAICQRLDGLPLAIELAAARVKLLSPQAILARLDRPLSVLTGGARDLPDRQRALSAAIQWSYDLLTPEEQRLFRRLSVFIGGWTIESAEAVVNADGDLAIDILNGLASLVDKSLVLQRDQPTGDSRFDMLGTIREFGITECLHVEDVERLHRAHAQAVVRLLGHPEILPGPEHGWARTVHDEIGNIHAALAWLIQTHDATQALTIVDAMFGYWFNFGQYREALRLTERTLAISGEAPLTLQCLALGKAAYLAHFGGEFERARVAAVDAVARGRESQNNVALAWALMALTLSESHRGAHEQSIALGSEAVELAREQDDPSLLAFAINRLGIVLEQAGDVAGALAMSREAHEHARRDGNPTAIAITTGNIGVQLFEMGDETGATPHLQDALRVLLSQSAHAAITNFLIALGLIAVHRGDTIRSVRLLGYADAHAERTGFRLGQDMAPIRDRLIAETREQLGETLFERHHAEGARMGSRAIADDVAAVTRA